MKISVSSYSYSQYINAGKMDLFGAVETAKKQGYEGIEFTDLPFEGNERLELAAALKEKAEKEGIAIVAYSVGANLYQGSPEADEKEVTRLKEQADVAAALGCGIMRHDVCWSLAAGRSFGLMLPTIAANARKITEYAQTKGIRTCTENHGFICQDAYRMEQLFNAVGHENYGLLVDIGNFCCADEICPKSVGIVAPYAIHCHAKDMQLSKIKMDGFSKTRMGNYFAGVVLGEGDCGVYYSLRALKTAGYDGWCSVEYEGRLDCVEAVGRCRENLESMFKAIDEEK